MHARVLISQACLLMVLNLLHLMRMVAAIEFRESTASDGLFEGHQNCGTVSCGVMEINKAFVKLAPNQGTQEVSCFSAAVLVCLPATSHLILPCQSLCKLPSPLQTC